MIEQVQTHERRDLVVAAAPRPQLAAELGTDLGDEGGLERAVHVFVAGSRLQSAVLHARRERVEAGVHPTLLVAVEVSRLREGARMRVRTREVVGRELPVEVRGTAQLSELGRGT